MSHRRVCYCCFILPFLGFDMFPLFGFRASQSNCGDVARSWPLHQRALARYGLARIILSCLERWSLLELIACTCDTWLVPG